MKYIVLGIKNIKRSVFNCHLWSSFVLISYFFTWPVSFNFTLLLFLQIFLQILHSIFLHVRKRLFVDLDPRRCGLLKTLSVLWGNVKMNLKLHKLALPPRIQKVLHCSDDSYFNPLPQLGPKWLMFEQVWIQHVLEGL